MTAWTYLIVSASGEVYLGATTHLRNRIRSHNSPRNTGYTKGRRWHLLATVSFPTRKEAFEYEGTLKRFGKNKWKANCATRGIIIANRFGYTFDSQQWVHAYQLNCVRNQPNENYI